MGFKHNLIIHISVKWGHCSSLSLFQQVRTCVDNISLMAALMTSYNTIVILKNVCMYYKTFNVHFTNKNCHFIFLFHFLEGHYKMLVYKTETKHTENKKVRSLDSLKVTVINLCLISKLPSSFKLPRCTASHFYMNFSHINSGQCWENQVQIICRVVFSHIEDTAQDCQARSHIGLETLVDFRLAWGYLCKTWGRQDVIQQISHSDIAQTLY